MHGYVILVIVAMIQYQSRRRHDYACKICDSTSYLYEKSNYVYVEKPIKD